YIIRIAPGFTLFPYTTLFRSGVYYELGLRVERNYSEAANWYRKAADQGLAHAQYNLGICYDVGHGVPRDYEEAVKWFRKAADQRSEEHTSELQSLRHLVCRLL